MLKMFTIGRNAHVQTFAKVVDSFVDRYLWQVIPDLLSTTFQPIVRPTIPSDNHRPPLISWCSLQRLEYFTCLPPIISIRLNFLAMAQDISVSSHLLMLLCNTARRSYAITDFVVAIAVLATLKNSD